MTAIITILPRDAIGPGGDGSVGFDKLLTVFSFFQLAAIRNDML
jgi:hypothetical protein